jgi:stage II sporulation protein D
MRRSIARRTPFASWTSLGALLLVALGGCAPRVTAVPQPHDGEPLVRVGILVDTAQATLGSTADYQVSEVGGRVLHRMTTQEQVVLRAGPGGELLLGVGPSETRVAGPVAIRPSAAGFLTIGERSYRGTAVVQPGAAGRLTVVNLVPMEDYLLGVVPYEIGRVGPELLEASKAQAVAARTYAVRYLGRREALGFDVFATVQDQVYGGAQGEHEPVSQAVRETRGEILTFGGEPIEAFYHSTCAGQTAAIEEVWPTESPRPYLVSVVDVNPATGEAFDVTSNRFRWTERWGADQLREIFNRTLADSLPAGVRDVGEIRNFETLELTQSGRIRALRITTANAQFVVGGDRIRWIFLTPAGSILNSSKFEPRIERDAQGRPTEIVADGMGWGHGIGMCQVGAMGRARAGQTYRTILQTYYPGTAVATIF